MTRKIRIDFQKIINKQYPQKDLLLAYQWLMDMGSECHEVIGWNEYSLHKSFHGYSYNKISPATYRLCQNWEKIIYDGFVNLLCKTNHPRVVREFLEKNRIQIGKVRIITIDEEGENKYYSKLTQRSDIGDAIDHLVSAYKGLELSKQDFIPTRFEGDVNPRIIDNAHFGIMNNKWYVSFLFSFANMRYESGWEHTIRQGNNEELGAFFNRAIECIDKYLLPTTSCDNCPMWLKHGQGDYLRHGYQGVCRLYGKCEKRDVVKYKWWSEDGRVVDNAIHDSIVFPYSEKRI